MFNKIEDYMKCKKLYEMKYINGIENTSIDFKIKCLTDKFVKKVIYDYIFKKEIKDECKFISEFLEQNYILKDFININKCDNVNEIIKIIKSNFSFIGERNLLLKFVYLKNKIENNLENNEKIKEIGQIKQMRLKYNDLENIFYKEGNNKLYLVYLNFDNKDRFNKYLNLYLFYKVYEDEIDLKIINYKDFGLYGIDIEVIEKKYDKMMLDEIINFVDNNINEFNKKIIYRDSLFCNYCELKDFCSDI